jgi:hypothetical protein
MKKTFTIIIVLILSADIANSQMEKSHFHAISLNFLQIKEELNYGMVFHGPGLGYAYAAQWQNDKNRIQYEGRITFSTPLTRGIIAASFNIVPVRMDYLFKLGSEKAFSIGPYFTMEYNYELYPDLQSGYSYWLTHFSLGGVLNYSFDVKQHQFDLLFHTTLLGFTSRNPVYDDPYFFDLGLGYVLGYLHQDLQFGSLNRYNQSELEIRWQPKSLSRLAFEYTFQYYGYFDEPKLTMLNQSIKLIILPK